MKFNDLLTYCGYKKYQGTLGTQCGVLLESSQERRRHISSSAILTTLLMVLMVVTSFGNNIFSQEHLALLGFIGITLLVFGFLVIFCLRRLELHKQGIFSIRENLPLKSLNAAYQTLNQIPPTYKTNNKTQTNTTPEQKFTHEIITLFKQMPQHQIPVFIKLKVQEFIHRLELCQHTPQSGYYHLTAQFAPYPAETEDKFIAQLYVTSLLFIGIIGTFHGLIVTFQGENIAALLQAYGSQSNTGFRHQLSQVLAGFHEAFGSSLIAYISYLLGRSMLDAVDDDHDALIDFVDERLKTIASAFAGIKVDTFIDLPQSTKIILENSANSMKNALEQHANIIEKSNAMLETYVDFGQKLIAAIGEARKDWKAAAKNLANNNGKIYTNC